jgi:hypothetical protein
MSHNAQMAKDDDRIVTTQVVRERAFVGNVELLFPLVHRGLIPAPTPEQMKRILAEAETYSPAIYNWTLGLYAQYLWGLMK